MHKKIGRIRKRATIWKEKKEVCWYMEFPGVWPGEGWVTKELAKKALEEYREEYAKGMHKE